MLSQQGMLRGKANLSPADARQVEVRTMLMASDVFRFHKATQECLNLSTSLTDMIEPCESLGLVVDAAIKMEAANSLWDHGEMTSSIGLLQRIDQDSSLKKQTVPVSRSNLLSKIGHQVSVARLENPQTIQKRYLEPALKELKGKVEGKEAGHVFHQFAMFCDEQLQNPDGLEDLARLQNLRHGKSEEVIQLKELIASTRETQLRNRYTSHLAKARQWLELDEQELRRVEQTRNAVVSSGDPGVFAMAAAVLEESADPQWAGVPVRVLPGITAAHAVASRVGAPLGHDYATISLSDRLKPWEVVARRLAAVAAADMAIAVYNPASSKRTWQVGAMKDIVLAHRAPATPVVLGRDVGGPQESVRVVTLGELDPAEVDMRTLLIIGASTTAVVDGDGTPRVFTARRYHG